MYLKQRLEIRLTDKQTGTQPYNQYQQMKHQFVLEVIKAAFSQVNHLSAESFLNTFFFYRESQLLCLHVPDCLHPQHCPC